MKKVIFILSVVTLMFTVNSCNKVQDNLTTTSVNPNVNIAEQLKRAVLKIPKDNSKCTENPAYSANTWDYVGVNHNAAVDFILSSKDFNSDDAIGIIDIGNTYNAANSLPVIPNESSFLAISTTIAENVFSGASLNASFYNSFSGIIDSVELSILVTYHSVLDTITGYNCKIRASKAMEYVIINSTTLDSATQARLLITTATFRYSTYYWMIIKPKGGADEPVGGPIDDIFNYLCMQDDWAQCAGECYVWGSVMSVLFYFGLL